MMSNVKRILWTALFSLSLITSAWAAKFTNEQLTFMTEHQFALVAFFECGIGGDISEKDIEALNLQLNTKLPKGWKNTEEAAQVGMLVLDILRVDRDGTCAYAIEIFHKHLATARQLEPS